MADRAHSIDQDFLTNSRSLTLADLNTQVGHEPRVHDLRLAEALGFSDGHKIRPLIARHIDALRGFGEVSAVQRKPGAAGGRPGTAFYLNRKQALFITAKSDTPRSAEVTIQMVEVFDEYLSGQLATGAPPDLAPGLFRMMVGRREILVDANDYQIGPGDEAVVCNHEGRISIMRGPLAPNDTASRLGARAVLGPWRKTTLQGAIRERGYVTVMGRVIHPGEKRRRMLIAA